MATADDARAEAKRRYVPLGEQPGALTNAFGDVFVAGATWHESQQGTVTREALAHAIASSHATGPGPHHSAGHPTQADYTATDATIAYLTHLGIPVDPNT